MRLSPHVVKVLSVTASVLFAISALSVRADDLYEVEGGKETLKERGVLVLETSADRTIWVRLEKRGEPGEVIPGEVVSGVTFRVAYSAPPDRAKLIERWLRAFPKAEVTTVTGNKVFLFGFGLKQCVAPGYVFTSSWPELVHTALSPVDRGEDIPFGEMSKLSVQNDQLITGTLKDSGNSVRVKAPRWSQYPIVKPCFTGFIGREPQPAQRWERFDITIDKTKEVIFK